MSPRRCLAAFSLLLAAAGCRPPTGPPDRIVLVTVDTLRADHLGSYGYPLDVSPFLDSLAARGVRFANAFSQASTTAPSHASLFTGLYPVEHDVQANGRRLDASFVTLAEALEGAGYRTAAFVSTNAHFGVGGLCQGFAICNEQPIDNHRTESGRRVQPYRPAAQTIDAALAWLRSAPSTQRLFLWVHLYDPHKPLRPPPADLEAVQRLAASLGSAAHREYLRVAHGNPRRRRLYRKILRYDAEIRYADAQLGRLYDALRDPACRDLWVVTADHGQGLDSHDGWFGHARQVYNTQLHVPVILHFSDDSLEPRVVDDRLVQLVDLMPTLLELAGVEARQEHAPLHGTSLAAYLLGGSPPAAERYNFAQSSWYRRPIPGRLPNRRPPKFALQSLATKYILNTGAEDELFDLQVDPGERHNLISEPELATRRAQMQAALLAILEAAGNAPAEAGTVDDEALERLRSLGYLQ